jgi:hypothetical protein
VEVEMGDAGQRAEDFHQKEWIRSTVSNHVLYTCKLLRVAWNVLTTKRWVYKVIDIC